ncbi:hypothetical protein NDU88_003353 [Pleurodeles waltl]|uniref:Peptidase A2 domain-containing protein n=1 Tax=Pleurodeles waltl TaxID=8319 RepID=A0AAV7W1W2_PLEWA|nr:hypothetical protein NDU88_003353 [Pleurodeles waltl]
METDAILYTSLFSLSLWPREGRRDLAASLIGLLERKARTEDHMALVGWQTLITEMSSKLLLPLQSAKKKNVRCVLSENVDNGCADRDNNEYVLIVKEATTPTNKVVVDPDIDVAIEGVVVKRLVDTGARNTIVSQ